MTISIDVLSGQAVIEQEDRSPCITDADGVIGRLDVSVKKTDTMQRFDLKSKQLLAALKESR